MGCLNEYSLNNKIPINKYVNKINKYPRATPNWPKPKAFNLKNIHDQTLTNLLCWVTPKSVFYLFIFFTFYILFLMLTHTEP